MRRAKRYILAREGPCWARHRTTTACPEIDRGGRLLPSLPSSRVVDFSRRLAVYVRNFQQAPAPIQTFSTAPGAAEFSRRLASRVVDFSRVQAAYPCEIFTPSACPNIVPPRLELLTFLKGWRPARVRFSAIRGTNPDIFRPLVESLTFP